VPQHDILKETAVRTTEQPVGSDFHGHHRDRVSKAFSSEVDAGSREENASNKRPRVGSDLIRTDACLRQFAV
jgi:hypothetical protein